MLVGQNIQNLPQNTNFKSRIVISPKAFDKKPFDKLVDLDKYISCPWTMDESRMLDEGFSDGAGPCTMGFIKLKGGKEGYFFHSIPSNRFEEVKKAITRAVGKLTKGKNLEIEGFLVGGIDKSCCGDRPLPPMVEKSISQYEKLMGLFDELKIKYSALLGQKDSISSTNMHVSAPKDEYTIDFLGKAFESTGSKERDIEELKKHFGIVKIRHEDEIELGE